MKDQKISIGFIKEKPESKEKIKEELKKEEPKIVTPAKVVNPVIPCKVVSLPKIKEPIAKINLDTKQNKILELIKKVPKEKKGFFNFFRKKKAQEKMIEKSIEKSLQIPSPSFSGKVSTPVIPIQKDITMQTDEDYNLPLKCPLCKGKIKKGWVHRDENIATQVYKCKNPNCIFVKEFKFSVRNY